MLRRSKRNSEESVLVIVVGLVSLLLTALTLKAWWHADTQWLYAIHLSIMNIVVSTLTYIATFYIHWVVGWVVLLTTIFLFVTIL